MVSGINAEDIDRDEQPLAYSANILYVPIKDRASTTRTEFPQYLPFWDEAFPDDPAEFEYHDPALRAAKDMPNLFRAGIKVRDITPKMGTIITGLDLKGLSDATKDELALLIAQRKVVVLRDQLAFLQTGPDHQQDFMTYFGKLNVQPASGSVIGNPAFHIVYRDDNEEIDVYLRRKTTTTGWHQDVSYERQPPGYVMLGILACPDVGGDTIFADTNEAYR